MKRNLLLTAAALTVLAMSAQTDYAPKNWKFKDMPVGSAESIFLRKGASSAWGIKAGFQNYTTNGEGGVCLADYVEGGTDDASLLPEETLERYEEFYNAAQIVNAGTENILCLIGNAATATYPGGVKAPSMPNATLFWLSGEDMPVDKYYRLTMEFRCITDNDYLEGLNLTIGGADWYGIDTDTEFSGSYREFKSAMAAAYSNYWLKATLDIFIDEKGAGTNMLPIGIKMNLINTLENSVLLMRSLKLEQIDAPNMDYYPGKVEVSDFTDNPVGGVSELASGNDVIVAAANGNITVIDANAPIEVYNIAGAKVASVAAPSTVETISLDMNGVFVVKVGGKAQKVIL